MKAHLRLWRLILPAIIIPGIVLSLIALTSKIYADNHDIELSPEQFINQLPDDIPDFVKDILMEEGVDLEELKNDPELRREIYEKVMSNFESLEELQQREAEEEIDETSREEPEDEQFEPRGDEYRSRGRGGINKYYKSVIDNNLFRPLGWRVKERGPNFRLIGTVIPKNKNPKALIFELSQKNTHYVAVGDKIGDATVKSIDEKSVTLDQDGEENPLKLNIVKESPFLGGSSSGRGRPRASSRPPSPFRDVRNEANEESSNSKLKERLENMSREDKEKAIQKFREAREKKGGRSLDKGERPVHREILRRR